MNSNPPRFDPWRAPALFLWLVFFAVGLVPEWVYGQLRNMGGVVTQRALINNMSLLPLAMAAYLTLFFYQRCAEAGLPPVETKGKSFQLGLLALIAFVLPVHLEQFMEYMTVPVAEYRRIIFGLIAAKCIAWLYLFSVIGRYYLGNGYRVFVRMPSLFPSVHALPAKQEAIPLPNATPEQETGDDPACEAPEDSARSVREQGF